MFDLQLSWVEEWHKKVGEKLLWWTWQNTMTQSSLSYLVANKCSDQKRINLGIFYLLYISLINKKAVLQAYNWLKVNGSTKLITIDAPSVPNMWNASTLPNIPELKRYRRSPQLQLFATVCHCIVTYHVQVPIIYIIVISRKTTSNSLKSENWQSS